MCIHTYVPASPSGVERGTHMQHFFTPSALKKAIFLHAYVCMYMCCLQSVRVD